MNLWSNPRFPYYLLSLLVAGALLTFLFVLAGFSDSALTLTFFDVGQGDAMLFRSRQGVDLLVDGGKNRTILEKLGSSIPLWDRKIELILLTHPDDDHIGGLPAVISRYDIGAILLTGVRRRNLASYQEIFSLAKNRSIPLIFVRSGVEISFGSDDHVEILAPQQDLRDMAVSNTNQTSVIALLSIGKIDALLTGDTEARQEKEIISRLRNGRKIEILKVAHHGSRSSSSEDFVKAVAPKLAVVSAGRNNAYGHPHQEVISRLEKVGSNIFRTDRDGDIAFWIQNSSLFKIKQRFKYLAFLYPLFAEKEFVLEGQ